MSRTLTDSSDDAASADAATDSPTPPQPHGYTTPDAMRRRNVITGITIITIVLLMIAFAILLPTLKS